jgi:hypothetical protein
MVKRVSLASFLLFFMLLANAQVKSSADQIIAKDAAWCWFSDPRAVYHKGKAKKIYFSYINSKGDVMINSRDLKSNKDESFVLHKELQVDDHNVASILVLPSGHLLAFYTEHNGRFFMRRTVNPEDISQWEAESVIPFGGKRITYSHPVMLSEEGNRIYMFWRGSDWRPSLSYSDDLGKSWSPTQALIDSKGKGNRPYLKVTTNHKNRIDFVFTDGHPGVETTNSVYHMYYKKGYFYQSNGVAIATSTELPVQHHTVQKVYDGNLLKVRGWISDVALDKNDQPVIVYTRYPQDNDHRYHYARWNGKVWLDQEICKSGRWMPTVPAGQKNREPHYSGGIALDHHDPSNVYLSRQVNNIFEVEHYAQKKNNWEISSITCGSRVNNFRPYVIEGQKTKKPLVLWMTGWYQHYTKFNTDLKINQQR